MLLTQVSLWKFSGHVLLVYPEPRAGIGRRSAKLLLSTASAGTTASCVLRPPPVLSHWLQNDELILFPTIELGWMMSSSANQRLAERPHAQTRLGVSAPTAAVTDVD